MLHLIGFLNTTQLPEPVQPNWLNWLSETAKFTIPLVTGLLLMYFKHRYDIKTERRIKSTVLWRALANETASFTSWYSSINTTVANVEKNRIVFFTVDLPSIISDFAKRLSELSPADAIAYSEFASYCEIVRYNNKVLQEIVLKLALQEAESPPVRMVTALKSQAEQTKASLCYLTKAQYRVLQVIPAKYTGKRDSEIDRCLIALNELKSKFRKEYPETNYPGIKND